MTLAGLVHNVNLAWLILEVGLMVFTRRNHRSASPRDRGSRTLLWFAIGVGLAGGTAAQAVSATRIRLPEPWWLGASLLLLAAGLVLRWTAILTLGRYFHTRVIIHPDHRLVRTGLYGLVRHPSYSGLVLLYLGMALSFGNWLSFALIVPPFLAALLFRIRVEESSLTEALGQDYTDYCRKTRRLVPGLY